MVGSRAIAEIGTGRLQKMLGGRMMARIALRVLAVICFLLLYTAAVAQVHVPEPSVNLGDTSFLDGVGGPGLLVEEIGDAYHSGAPTVNSIGGLTHIAWLSDRRLLRAWFGVEVVSAAAHVNIGGAGSAGGWGDVTVSPLILQWKEQNVGGVRIDQRLVFDFNPPTGEYQRTSGVNLGSNAFSAHPYYAITLFPAKYLETSWRIHYLWNATNNAPSRTTVAYSTQAGQAVHFNATVGYNLTHRFWIGANGYYLKQITAPQVNGVSLLHSPEQVGAIGPGLMWQLGRCFLYANAYHELGVENRPRGNRLVLRIEWVFPTTTTRNN